MPHYDYCCEKCGEMEIFHSIKEDTWQMCPECGKKGLIRLISSGGGVIIGNREANQYNDIKYAKYWRDKNGIRHRVTPADGNSKSSTVSRQTASPQEVAARKKQAQILAKKRRSASSYKKYVEQTKREKKQ